MASSIKRYERKCTCSRKKIGDRWECCLEPSYRDALLAKKASPIGSGQSGTVVAYNGRVYKTLLLDSPSSKSEFDSEARFSELFASHGIGPEVHSIFVDKKNRVGVIEMEQFEMSALKYLTDTLGKPKVAPKAYQTKLKSLLRRMVAIRAVCEDLRPENFVVRVAKSGAVDLRLIDYGGDFCTQFPKQRWWNEARSKDDMLAAMAMLTRWHTWHLTRRGGDRGVDVLPTPVGDPATAAQILLERNFVPYLMGYYGATADGEHGSTIEANRRRGAAISATMVRVLRAVASGQLDNLPLKPWGQIELEF